MSLPDPKPVLDLIEAFRHSKTMFAAVSMGVFDVLQQGPSTAADLASRLSANTDAMGRLLDACAALGLLQKSGGVYRNDAVADFPTVVSVMMRNLREPGPKLPPLR